MFWNTELELAKQREKHLVELIGILEDNARLKATVAAHANSTCPNCAAIMEKMTQLIETIAAHAAQWQVAPKPSNYYYISPSGKVEMR